MHIREEHLSALIDGQLSPEERLLVEQKLREDPAFAAEYRSVLATKMLLRRRASTLRKAIPPDARKAVLLALEQAAHYDSIMHHIHQSSHQESSSLQEHQPTLSEPKAHITSASHYALTIIQTLQSRPFVLAAAFGLLILGWLGIQLFISQNHDTSPKVHRSNERTPYHTAVFVQESLQNYYAVREGKITLQYRTSSYQDLDQFFRSHGIDYHIVHPRINAQLLGGVVSEERGKKSAHLVFQRGATLLYMWELNIDETLAQHIAFHDSTWQLLHKGEWLWYTGDSTTVVFWEDRDRGLRTLCSVVTSLPRNELQQLFQ
ncbi:MAG: hypothetical protein RML40_04445 [Bacteroidota bacterium]|nr:hypothetical protein [Bacteroidota bacterium]